MHDNPPDFAEAIMKELDLASRMSIVTDYVVFFFIIRRK